MLLHVEKVVAMRNNVCTYKLAFIISALVIYNIETIRASAALFHNDVSFGWIPTVNQDGLSIAVRLEDKSGAVVATGTHGIGYLSVPNATLWWPFSMVKEDEQAGYLYTMVVCNI